MKNLHTEKSPTKLWEPSSGLKKKTNLYNYIQWLKKNYDLDFEDYHDLWLWSVQNLGDFWESVWKYFRVISSTPYTSVVSQHKMPYTKWFEGAYLNYAEHIFRNETENYPAIIYKSETSAIQEMSWKELRQKVSAFRTYLLSIGIKPGDRVAAYLPNIPEANIAFLAANSIGAVWSSSSPDFGTASVIDRFSQIEPRVLIAVNAYQYGGKYFDRSKEIVKISESLRGLEKLIIIAHGQSEQQSSQIPGSIDWKDTITHNSEELKFERVPFDHPMWVLYSSGTTGLPKAITHSHGGILLEHLKYLTFHNDIKPGDRCFWYTTTGWMMWNYIQASLLMGGVLVLYDGSPGYPDMNVLWEFAQEVCVHHFGTSAAYIVANMKGRIHPSNDFDLSNLRSLSSTGSPLPPEGFDWIYREVKNDLWLASISGGTDVCSAFVGGNPLWPVYSGEIQCRALACSLEAFNDEGQAVQDEMGEMVITMPMPSMPICFWNDKDFIRYKESYFEMYPGKWRHGDWTKITPRHGVIIYGRSDSTLNRGGVRIGTSEIYRVVDKIPEIVDSLILFVEKSGSESRMPLFVVLKKGLELNEEIREKVRITIRREYTPRHVPDEIIQVDEIPYTISGKKMETPIKKILAGQDPDKVISADAVKNPESLEFFINMARI
ncbi:MAG: acetoacetate--CoA ligase [Bacteroidota bacterium]|nr:acetoacetate--CoA ligase [Bacteroidota bacterium]